VLSLNLLDTVSIVLFPASSVAQQFFMYSKTNEACTCCIILLAPSAFNTSASFWVDLKYFSMAHCLFQSSEFTALTWVIRYSTIGCMLHLWLLCRNKNWFGVKFEIRNCCLYSVFQVILYLCSSWINFRFRSKSIYVRFNQQ
jgi:hypothetical protein